MSFSLPTTGHPVIDGVIAVILFPLIWKISYWVSERVKGEAQKAQSQGLPSVPEVWEEMRELRVEMKGLQDEADAQRKQSNGHASELFRISQRLHELELSERRLIGWTLKIRDGVKDGTIPPYPMDPDWLIPYIDDADKG